VFAAFKHTPRHCLGALRTWELQYFADPPSTLLLIRLETAKFAGNVAILLDFMHCRGAGGGGFKDLGGAPIGLSGGLLGQAGMACRAFGLP